MHVLCIVRVTYVRTLVGRLEKGRPQPGFRGTHRSGEGPGRRWGRTGRASRRGRDGRQTVSRGREGTTKQYVFTRFWCTSIHTPGPNAFLPPRTPSAQQANVAGVRWAPSHSESLLSAFKWLLTTSRTKKRCARLSCACMHLAPWPLGLLGSMSMSGGPNRPSSPLSRRLPKGRRLPTKNG